MVKRKKRKPLPRLEVIIVFAGGSSHDRWAGRFDVVGHWFGNDGGSACKLRRGSWKFSFIRRDRMLFEVKF